MDVTSFVIYCFIVTFTPGPSNIVILSMVQHYGAKKALKYTYGASIAFGILLGISAILNSVLITIMPKLLMGMQIIGTVYMLYLAWQIYKMDASETEESKSGTFRTGFLMQFLNPKVVMFTMTVLPTFILPYYAKMSAVLISVIVITMIGLSAFMAWVLFGTIFKQFLQKQKRIANAVMALCLVYAACMIWI